MSDLLDYVEVVHNPTNKPIDKAVIWLHGLGASGHDFAVCVPHLGLPDELAVRFIFPHAPHAPVTVNGGHIMPSWYDILEMDLERKKVDVQQIKQSSDGIGKLIDEQVDKGVPSQNIIIAGFSQGGAVAYHHVLTSPRPLAGLLAMSTYFATKDDIPVPTIATDIPIRIDHGSYDDVVPMTLGVQAYERLRDLGFHPQFNRYPMAHQASLAQLGEIGRWIGEVFG
ncbi:MAG: carboxylesterase [Moraxella sp.]|nr:carboxylesterase [Moraxella sp.]